jgi:hypothetical protein
MSTCPMSSKPTLLGRLGATATAFVSAPASPLPLAVLRIGLAAVLLLQALSIAGKLSELYGEQGIIQWSIVHTLSAEGMPRIAWIAEALAPYGVSADDCVRGVFLVQVASLACLLIGWHTHLAALLAWLTHLAMTVSGNASIYGVDQFAIIGLFYCVCLPVGEVLSADRTAGRTSGEPSAAARLGLRLLQLHLCVVYLSSGIEKASGEQWWNGEAIWRALQWPDMAFFNFNWLAEVPWLALLICWGTLLVEIGYAFFIWPRWTRKLCLLATVGLHVGIAATMGLVFFSAVMIVFNVAAFGFSAEPRPAAPAKGGPC